MTETLESQSANTLDLWPVADIRDGVLHLTNGRKAIIVQLDGIDPNLLMMDEQASLARGFERVFRTIGGEFSFYVDMRPRDLSAKVAAIRARSRAERRNPMLIPLRNIEADYWEDQSRKRQTTERRYFIVLQDIAADRNEILRRGLPRLRVPQRADKTQLIRERDPKEALVVENLIFRAEQVADSLSRLRIPARLLTDSENIQLVGEWFASPAARRGDELAEARARIGGATLQETAFGIQLDGEESRHVSSLWVTDLPQRLPFGALGPVLRLPDISMSVAIHVTPIDPTKAADSLKNKIELINVTEATGHSSAGNIQNQLRAQTASDMRIEFARGKLYYRASLTFSIRGETSDAAYRGTQSVASALVTSGYKVAAATYNQRRAFVTTAPLGLDQLGSDAITGGIARYPNCTAQNIAALIVPPVLDYVTPNGIFVGRGENGGELATYDRWGRDTKSPHTFKIAGTGSGKTVSGEAEWWREIEEHDDLDVFIFDPQGATPKFAHMLGGTVIPLNVAGGACVNMVDRFSVGGRPESLAEKMTYLVPQFDLMLREETTQTDRTAIGDALENMYAHFEEGETMLPSLLHSYTHNPRYAAIAPYVADGTNDAGETQPGILSKLDGIYARLNDIYHIPTHGVVNGGDTPDGYRRPICRFDSAANRWIYAGDGETDSPYIDASARMFVERTLREEGLPTDTDVAERLIVATIAAVAAVRKVSPAKNDVIDLRSTFNAVKTQFAPLVADASLQSGAQAVLKAFDNQTRHRPALAWYPDTDWYARLDADFTRMVREAGLFTSLEPKIAEQATRDALVEMKRGMPILSDLLPFVAAEARIVPQVMRIVENLAPYVNPKDKGTVFNGYTNVNLSARCIVFDMEGVSTDQDDLRTIRLFQFLNYVWAVVRAYPKRYICVIDEMGDMLESYPEVGNFARRLWMRGRRFGFAMEGIVQNLLSLVSNRNAIFCLQNSGRVMLMGNETTALPDIRAVLHTSDGEEDILVGAKRGEGITILQREGRPPLRMHCRTTMSPYFLKLWDTRPVRDEDTL